jgi:hypothetical protein
LIGFNDNGSVFNKRYVFGWLLKDRALVMAGFLNECCDGFGSWEMSRHVDEKCKVFDEFTEFLPNNLLC